MKTKEECIKWLEMFLNASMKQNAEDQNFIRSIIEHMKNKDDNGKEIKEAFDYLDWHFEADDGTADKDAQKAWHIIKNYITQNSKNMDGIKE